MRFQITAGGFAAAFNASNQGPVIKISQFRVGAGFGYEAVIADDSLHGVLLYTGTPTGYRVIDNNTCEFSIIMSEDVGSFEFGEISLDMADGTIFALGTLQVPQYKVAYPDQDFNRYHVRIRLTINEAIPKIELVMIEQIAGTIWELPSVEQLPLPGVAMTNVYLCHSLDHNGADALCTLNPTLKRWTINSHMFRVESGVIDFVGQSATNIRATGKLAQSDYADGRYLIQLTSGPNSGQVRQVKSLGGGKAGWTMPLSVAVGDSYELLRDHEDNNGAAEDAAFFYYILGTNK